ncbi:unnamed protein product [Ectocarpus fasciculatus]
MEVDEGVVFQAGQVEADAAAAAAAAGAEDVDMDTTDGAGAAAARPDFPALTAREMGGGKDDFRSIRCPPHRLTPLRNSWENIVTPTVEHMKLQISRFNRKTRNVELKSSTHTEDASALQKTADFVQAFMLGFEVQDAVALLRLDDLYVDSFQVQDVKTLTGDHLSRAIGRIAGQGGKTRHAIENATRTRIIVADQKVHILGSFSNIKVARDAICALILGAPPGKVYNQMRNVARRMSERF